MTRNHAFQVSCISLHSLSRIELSGKRVQLFTISKTKENKLIEIAMFDGRMLVYNDVSDKYMNLMFT